ncbi:MAG: DUF4931 domain-containing protein [Nitrososphaerota archaeon]|nr:DUF4931 domain-containing protein [Candidatus Bathyarchaeota archaeon]MCX8161822.1 DUF4931 domain-containing protein [Candidatus Bathyarchaeota archaeon]MDW8062041.1 DUF4931 domain-containing protein [Nitrososphaerota archaeon]
MSKLTRSPLTGEWVVYAPRRGRRPIHYGKIEGCPFCPGNEYATPPAKLLYVRSSDGSIHRFKDGDGGRRSDWIVRVFDNLYPIFSDSPESVYGYHEVLVETPRHEDKPWSISIDQQAVAIQAALERIDTMRSDPKIGYVLLFKNYGRSAGASIEHMHMQIVASPILPPRVESELSSYRDGCPVCMLIRESPSVVSYDDIVVVCPKASFKPYEAMVTSIEHKHDIPRTESYIEALAKALVDVMHRLRLTLGEFEFNYWLHYGLTQDHHWHIEILPKTSIWAGLELGGWIYVNTLPPNEAADSLRRSSLQHP